MSDVMAILRHLEEKGTYDKEYIDRVALYMKRHPDLAKEFVDHLPKNTIIDNCISVGDYSIKRLGATTMLSRSAIYVALARIRDGENPETVINEEIEYLKKHKQPKY